METDCSEPELEDETAGEEASVPFEPLLDSSGNQRRKSFVWRYFRPVDETAKAYECVICNSCVGNQTSNLARHLLATHNIKRQEEGVENTRGRPSRSFIWKYCTKENSKYARCHLCKKLLYFGGGNTGNISKHLRRMHAQKLDSAEMNLNADGQDETMDESNETMHAVASIDSGVDDAAATSAMNGGLNENGRVHIKREVQQEREREREREQVLAQQRKERKGGSYVWKYCDKLTRHTIRCKLCEKVMSFHGTANVITHLQRRHNILGKVDGEQQMRASWASRSDSVDLDESKEDTLPQRRRCAAATSVVWKYCSRITKDVARCGFCKKNLSYQGTSNLQRHLHRMHGVVTQGRSMTPLDTPWVSHHVDRNFIWEHCTTTDDDKIKCNMCGEVFEGKDMTKASRHLQLDHMVRPSRRNSGREASRKRRRSQSEEEASDDGGYGNDDAGSWSRGDDDDYVPEHNDESSKKNDSLYDDLIEEEERDQTEEADYDEDPFDPSVLQDYPFVSALSPQSSDGGTPGRPNNKSSYGSARLRKLNEERLRTEAEYFREKAGFYRMQKYLTALQAKKVRLELSRMRNPDAEAEFIADSALVSTQ